VTEPDSVHTEQPDPPGAAEGRAEAGTPRKAHGRFADEYSARVSSLIGQPVVLAEPICARKSYAEFLATIREPTCCGLFAAEATGSEAPPAAGLIWLELPAAAAYAMVDALLGGAGQGIYIPDRPLTAVERRLLRPVMAAAAECLGQCIPVSASVQPAPQGGARSSARLPDARNDQPVAVWTFTISICGQKGRLSVCLPCWLLESAPPGKAAPPRRAGPVEISAALSDVPIEAEDLANLRPGDILTTDTPVDGEVIVRVAGIPKYRARLGVCNRRRAVTITGPFLTPEPGQDAKGP
jgi:flagellar motor switch protein FliM